MVRLKWTKTIVDAQSTTQVLSLTLVFEIVFLTGSG